MNGSPPSMFSFGILTSSKCTDVVLHALIPIFFSGGPLAKNKETIFSNFVQYELSTGSFPVHSG